MRRPVSAISGVEVQVSGYASNGVIGRSLLGGIGDIMGRGRWKSLISLDEKKGGEEGLTIRRQRVSVPQRWERTSWRLQCRFEWSCVIGQSRPRSWELDEHTTWTAHRADSGFSLLEILLASDAFSGACMVKGQ